MHSIVCNTLVRSMHSVLLASIFNRRQADGGGRFGLLFASGDFEFRLLLGFVCHQPHVTPHNDTFSQRGNPY